MMKLIPHAQNAVGRWLTVKANAVAKRKAANAKNMVLRFVVPFANASQSAHTLPLSRQW